MQLQEFLPVGHCIDHATASTYDNGTKTWNQVNYNTTKIAFDLKVLLAGSLSEKREKLNHNFEILDKVFTYSIIAIKRYNDCKRDN